MHIKRIFSHQSSHVQQFLQQGMVYAAVEQGWMGMMCVRTEQLPEGWVLVLVHLEGMPQAKQVLAEHALQVRDVLGVQKLVVQCWGREQVVKMQQELGMILDPFGAMCEIKPRPKQGEKGGTNVVRNLPVRITSKPTESAVAGEGTDEGVERENDAGDGGGGGAAVRQGGAGDSPDARPVGGAKAQRKGRAIQIPVDRDV